MVFGALVLLGGCASAAARADDSVVPDGTASGAGGETASGGGPATGVVTTKGGAGGQAGAPSATGGADGGAGPDAGAGGEGGSAADKAGASGKGGAAGKAGGGGKSGGGGVSGAPGKGGAAGKSGAPGIAGAGGKAPGAGTGGTGGATITGGGAGTGGDTSAGGQATAGTGGASGNASAGAAGQTAGAGGSGAPSVCGNGLLDAGEECDDGDGSGSPWCKKCKVECVYGKKRGTHCYELLEDGPNGSFESGWVSANTFCNSQVKGFGHLVTFDEFDVATKAAAEEEWVTQNVIGSGSSTTLWIGYSDRATEGIFTRYDGSPLIYTRWHSGEPNDAKGEDCVEMTYKSPFWGWNDNDCDNYRAFVCEYEPVIKGP